MGTIVIVVIVVIVDIMIIVSSMFILRNLIILDNCGHCSHLGPSLTIITALCYKLMTWQHS